MNRLLGSDTHCIKYELALTVLVFRGESKESKKSDLCDYHTNGNAAGEIEPLTVGRQFPRWAYVLISPLTSWPFFLLCLVLHHFSLQSLKTLSQPDVALLNVHRIGSYQNSCLELISGCHCREPTSIHVTLLTINYMEMHRLVTKQKSHFSLSQSPTPACFFFFSLSCFRLLFSRRLKGGIELISFSR